ncbi:hypothetical protein D931_00887 [Enterococcus faecium 13.SD.W.09]|nr:hypothetical protein D931_00887 [Enterococcus faecium 13.SD.W.09]
MESSEKFTRNLRISKGNENRAIRNVPIVRDKKAPVAAFVFT